MYLFVYLVKLGVLCMTQTANVQYCLLFKWAEISHVFLNPVLHSQKQRQTIWHIKGRHKCHPQNIWTTLPHTFSYWNNAARIWLQQSQKTKWFSLFSKKGSVRTGIKGHLCASPPHHLPNIPSGDGNVFGSSRSLWGGVSPGRIGHRSHRVPNQTLLRVTHRLIIWIPVKTFGKHTHKQAQWHTHTHTHTHARTHIHTHIYTHRFEVFLIPSDTRLLAH